MIYTNNGEQKPKDGVDGPKETEPKDSRVGATKPGSATEKAT